ncbi:MAG: glycosyltransferase [Dokdonella sp.]|uniref:glycosyltransferase n=1 Tax=Dokdonella sp. TaxID=2291710 RepID=UPI003266D5D6
MRICLNMIVRNEAPVIERCLASVRPHVDAWAIVDTGSTDGTQALIANAMRGIPGELVERDWVDFATNRNQALELASAYGTFALIVDADEVLHVDAGALRPGIELSAGMFRFALGELDYWRIALVRLDLDWRWRGVLHEVLSSPTAAAATRLKGWRVESFPDGARSRVPSQQKYGADARVLEQALVHDPDNTRYAFYYAQSLRDAGCEVEALAAYRRRISMGGWAEELYISRLQVALLLERAQAPVPDVVFAYLEAHEARSARPEAPCELARYLRLQQRYPLALIFARIAAEAAPGDDVLFIDTSVAAWRAHDEWSIACWYCGDGELSARLCEGLLAGPALPVDQRERVRRNLAFAIELRDR